MHYKRRCRHWDLVQYPELRHRGKADPKAWEAWWHSEGNDGIWATSTPSWYIRMKMTRPQRVEVRRLIHQVMRLADLQDAPIFPHPKRPHWYYW